MHHFYEYTHSFVLQWGSSWFIRNGECLCMNIFGKEEKDKNNLFVEGLDEFIWVSGCEGLKDIHEYIVVVIHKK